MYFQKIDDILTKPYSLWLISIIIAVGLWIYVFGGQAEGEITRTIIIDEIEYLNVAHQLEIKRDKAIEVRVDVSGRENEIEDLLKKDLSKKNKITCEADARGYPPGRYMIPVSISLPKGIKLIRVRPSQVEINLIRYGDRLVDVEVVLPKDLPEGLYLDLVEIIPKQATVKGIENDLARIGSIKISPTVEELRSGKELLLPPEAESSEPFDEEVKIEPKQIKLKAILASGYPRRMIPVRARMSGKPDEDYAVLSTTVAPAEVLVEGPKAVLDRLVSIETSTVDITGIKESASMVVTVKPPTDRATKVLGDGTVKVSINLQSMSATKEILNIPVKIEGGGQTSWKAVPPSVTVTIEGFPSNINSSASQSLDIAAYVNAENLFTKQATLPVRIRIDSDLFKVTKVNPYTISISSEP